MNLAVLLAHLEHFLHGRPGGGHQHQVVREGRGAVPLAGDVTSEASLAELLDQVIQINSEEGWREHGPLSGSICDVKCGRED